MVYLFLVNRKKYGANMKGKNQKKKAKGQLPQMPQNYHYNASFCVVMLVMGIRVKKKFHASCYSLLASCPLLSRHRLVA